MAQKVRFSLPFLVVLYKPNETHPFSFPFVLVPSLSWQMIDFHIRKWREKGAFASAPPSRRCGWTQPDPGASRA